MTINIYHLGLTACFTSTY
uniref:Uncharacterized protein n=1 Tax=Rhizophora mucronata TaxID=61149 RepID=A0A2P2PFT1_RHIMU